MKSTHKQHDTRLAVRITALDLESWRFAADDMGFTLSAMVRHAVNLYVKNPPGDDDLTDLKMSTVERLCRLTKIGYDRAWLRKTTLCDKTIVLRLPSTELQRWKIAAADEGRSMFGSTYRGRPLSAMIRRAVRRYVARIEDTNRVLFGVLSDLLG